MKKKHIKLKAKFIVDIIMIIAFLFNIFTGFAFFLGFITGGGQQYRGGRGAALVPDSLTGFINSKHVFTSIHNWSGIIILILIIVHIILNWDTLICYFKNLFRATKIAGPEKSAN